MSEITDDTLHALVGTLDLARKVRLLTGADIWSTVNEPALGLRSMTLSDRPSGVRGPAWDERDPALHLPSATALAATWDLDLARAYGATSAAEARRKGVDVVLGPTINVQRSPLGDRHFEAFSEDPLLTGRLAAAYVRAVQEHGIGATPKHYVANDVEADRYTADVEVDDRTLRELYLAPFEAAVRAGAWLVMSAYNAVNGVTMTENRLLTAPLRTEWGFDGVVVSDWTAVRSTEAAANADQDLVMPGPEGPWGAKLVEAVRAGTVPEAAVDAKVLRLLRLAARVGALDVADRGTPIARDGAVRSRVSHTPDTGLRVAREVAAAGMVLVRNDGELPWPSAGPGSIAVIGEPALWPRTQGGGSATVMPEDVISPVDGLRAALPGVTITAHPGVPMQTGLHPSPLSARIDPETGEPGLRARFLAADDSELLSEHRRAGQCESGASDPATAIDAAVRLARDSDVAVVVVGTGAQAESEGFVRTTLALPGAQDDLVRAVAAANPRTIVVVNSGGPVLLPWRDEVAAVLLAWFGGQQLGHALADVLLGHREPGGRLPTTWPAAESDVPVLSTAPVNGVLRYDEGIHIGYRAWLKGDVRPAYPFGHGLGYTTWALTDLTVAPPSVNGSVDIEVTVHNTGARAGKQVVQVYLSREDSAVDRPVRWLAGFTPVEAEAGRSIRIRIPLSPRAFAHWDGVWHIEPGVFTVHVGTSVTDLPLTADTSALAAV
ncbi:glycoside hydrolase family 3 C-terminal domain-containing protein [Nocardia sp. NPDC005366]|uniref:beta-glucosidase family protein n=1 Tax=Nocardia sp. NPDC005366 TaxID=3156878 RepID=UPI0033AA902C